MPTPKRYFENGAIYHIFNRGVDKRTIFLDPSYYSHFLQTIDYYRNERAIKLSEYLRSFLAAANDIIAKEKGALLIDFLCYCLMPNHFHLAIRQKVEEGVTLFLSSICNSFAHYFNIRNQRSGALFQGPFKAKLIETREDFLQVSRYIHLNSLEISKTLEGGGHPFNYPYSSLNEYVSPNSHLLISPSVFSDFRIDRQDYLKFVKGGIRLGMDKMRESLSHLVIE